jgi:hypothetical protein
MPRFSISWSKRRSAFHASRTAWSLSSSVTPRRGPQASNIWPGEVVGLVQRRGGVDVLDARAREEVDLLGERRPHDLGRAGDDRAARRSCVPLTNVGMWVMHGK